MRYLLLIVNDEQPAAGRPLDEAWLRTWEEFLNQMRAAGKLLGAERLRPSASATTVRRADGRTLLSDGPFTESKEQVAGYLLIEAKNLDEALEWANRLPTLERGGCVEVRPIWERGED